VPQSIAASTSPLSVEAEVVERRRQIHQLRIALARELAERRRRTEKQRVVVLAAGVVDGSGRRRHARTAPALAFGRRLDDRHVEQPEQLPSRLLNRVGEPLRAGLQSRGLDRIAALLGGHPALFRLFALLAAVGDLVGF